MRRMKPLKRAMQSLTRQSRKADLRRSCGRKLELSPRCDCLPILLKRAGMVEDTCCKHVAGAGHGSLAALPATDESAKARRGSFLCKLWSPVLAF